MSSGERLDGGSGRQRQDRWILPPGQNDGGHRIKRPNSDRWTTAVQARALVLVLGVAAALVVSSATVADAKTDSGWGGELLDLGYARESAADQGSFQRHVESAAHGKSSTRAGTGRVGAATAGRYAPYRSARRHAWSSSDAVGDVSSDATGRWVADQNRANGDFAAVGVYAKARRVKVVLSFRQLVSAPPRGDADFNIVVGLVSGGEDDPAVFVNIDSGSGSGLAGWDGLLSNGFPKYPCRGRTPDNFRAKPSSIAFAIPMRCLDGIKRFRVFAASRWQDFTTDLTDDALRTGMRGYRYAKSPYVYRR